MSTAGKAWGEKEGLEDREKGLVRTAQAQQSRGVE